MEINGNCVNDLYVNTLWWAKTAHCAVEETRVARARVYSEPLTIVNHNPRDRVLYHPARDANPFFQLMEAIWMLAGTNNDWIVQFNKGMKEYMDYGSFHGGYGYRWGAHFGFDQINSVINMLKLAPNTRRAYVSLWDPNADLGQNLKDLPCNVGLAFQVRDGKLNGYVFNRSNDLIWGMLGTNCVHFSVLLEVVASAAGLPLGKLYQHTINPHVYERHWDLVATPTPSTCRTLRPNYRIDVPDYKAFVEDCDTFLKHPELVTHPFLREVAAPMYYAYALRDSGSLKDIKADDWREACNLWWNKHRG